MAGDGVNWQGLLKWSLSHADGTASARNLSDEDRRWFMEAMREHSVDVIQRMKEITEVMKTPPDVLESQGVSTADIEGMLDELQEHVESIDMANDLHSIGGLSPLLGYLKNSHPSIRAKAEDVVMTIVQNNPKGQQLVMETSGLEPLLSNFSSDPDVTVRTKALGAISSLIRNNKAGVMAFKLANGYAALKDALISDDPKFQRKALNLIHYLLQDKSDCSTISELGFPKLMVHLASGDDSGVREAALAGLLELARDQSAGGASSLDKEKLQQVLRDRINGIGSMDADELGAAREERQLVDALWNACYSEPSALRENGLLVLPGEENHGQPPDVAGKLFEPPLRAWAAHNSLRSQTQNQSAEKDEKPPLLLGPGSSSSGRNL
ncbi:hypothetical protein HPP92_006643 [Vanilla planifolia]|uniref:TOG domain-containing protein n=1 Tax=Vanilla planifolia TaxID=51239 RepID=A0A835RKT4_VANPL|nr:hypothetical protein HPP92_006643 [Vanilla planifolia]